jgi:hypothetical protein
MFLNGLPIGPDLISAEDMPKRKLTVQTEVCGVIRSGYWMHINILWPTMPMYNMDGSLHNPIQVALLDGGRIITNNSNTRFAIGTELEPVSGWTTNISYNYTDRSGTTTNLMHPVETSVADGSDRKYWFCANRTL